MHHKTRCGRFLRPGLPGILLLCGATFALAKEAPQLLAKIQPPSTITLKATWSPIEYSRMQYLERRPDLEDILQPEAHTPEATYETGDFEAFFPPEDAEVGDVWKIQAMDAIPFLRQLHPEATPSMHHAPSGTEGAFACLVSDEDDRQEVLVRVHAEFRLDTDTDTIYYTPAQFEGRLIYNPETDDVVAFRLAVPARLTNVDINTYEKRGNGGGVDIVYVPQIEITSGDESTFSPTPKEEAITLEDARERLRKAFYPASDIEWLDFEDAWELTQETGRPLHALVILGNFDDESC